MALSCQRDSYLKILKTEVKSCTGSSFETVLNGKKVNLKGFEVILADTILFPEGGGQPSDKGTINGNPALNVMRRGADAVHFLEKEIPPGTEACVEVDWERRWDHMQQHSGQHLISALAISMFNFQTTSWNLGEKTSFVELNTNEMNNEQIESLERAANEKIKQCVAMYPRLIEDKDDPEAKEARCRGLPDDHVGPVRVVTIDGVDTNLCCGTHVSNLSHLQMIKLLGVEKGKKGKVNLVFLVGDRILKYVRSVYEKEKMLTSLLKGQPEDHVSLLQKIQASMKLAQKNSLSLLREIALLEAEKLKTATVKPHYFVLHKKEGDNEFMNIIANEIGNDILLFLTTGEEKGSGLFLLSGKPDDVKELGPKIAELLEGKGAGKCGKYQGKAGSLQKRGDVINLIKEYFNQQNSS